MYFNYILFKLYTRLCKYFFHPTSLVLGKGPVSFLGASKFFGGPVSFQISTGPPGHCIHEPNVKPCKG